MDDIKQEIERKGIEPTQEDGLNFVKHIMQSFLLPKLKNKLSPKAYNEYKQQIDEALERIKAATFQNQQLPEMIKIDDEIELFQNFRHFLFFKNSLRLTIKLVFFSFQRLKNNFLSFLKIFLERN